MFEIYLQDVIRYDYAPFADKFVLVELLQDVGELKKGTRFEYARMYPKALQLCFYNANELVGKIQFEFKIKSGKFLALNGKY